MTGDIKRCFHTENIWKPRRSTISQSSNGTLGNQKHPRLQSLSLKQVVESHWPSKDINPIAGSHICRAQFIKELQMGILKELQMEIFGHLQFTVIISWWFPHRYEFYKRHRTKCYDSGLLGIWVKSSIICGPNTTDSNVMTKLYNRIVSACKAWAEQDRLFCINIFDFAIETNTKM